MQAVTAAEQRLPTLPIDSPAPRLPSVSETFTLQGKEPMERSSPSLVVNDMLRVASSPLGFAIYRYSGLSQSESPNLITLRLGSMIPGTLYIGHSSQGGTRWSWQHVVAPTSEMNVPLAPSAKALTAFGNLYVAIVVMDETVDVKSVSLRLRHLAPPPVDLRAADGSRHGVELQWTDPDYTYSDDPYFFYDGVIVERAPADSEEWEQIALINKGTTTYFDDSAADLPPGLRLLYRLRCQRANLIGPPGVADVGFVDFLPVPSVDHLSETGMHGSHSPHYRQFDASDSYDPDGGSLTYEWDFESKGEWVTTADPIVGHTFLGDPAENFVMGRLRVLDDEGTYSVTIVFYFYLEGYTKLWKAEVNGNETTFLDAGTDQAGNLYVLFDAGVIAKFDTQFNLVWSRRWENSFTQIAVAADGSFYVAHGLAIDRFNSDGDLIWARRDEHHYNSKLRVASNGDLCLVAYSNWYFEGVRLMRISSEGEVVLSRRADLDLGDHLRYGSIASDEAGNTLLCGILDFGVTNSPYMALFDAEGGIVWQKRLVMASNHNSRIDAGWLSEAGAYLLRTDDGFHALSVSGEVLVQHAIYNYLDPEAVVTDDNTMFVSTLISLEEFNWSDAFLGVRDRGFTQVPRIVGVSGDDLILVGLFDLQSNWRGNNQYLYPTTATLEDVSLQFSYAGDYEEGYTPKELGTHTLLESADGIALCRLSK